MHAHDRQPRRRDRRNDRQTRRRSWRSVGDRRTSSRDRAAVPRGARATAARANSDDETPPRPVDRPAFANPRRALTACVSPDESTARTARESRRAFPLRAAARRRVERDATLRREARRADPSSRRAVRATPEHVANRSRQARDVGGVARHQRVRFEMEREVARPCARPSVRSSGVRESRRSPCRLRPSESATRSSGAALPPSSRRRVEHPARGHRAIGPARGADADLGLADLERMGSARSIDARCRALGSRVVEILRHSINLRGRARYSSQVLAWLKLPESSESSDNN